MRPRAFVACGRFLCERGEKGEWAAGMLRRSRPCPAARCTQLELVYASIGVAHSSARSPLVPCTQFEYVHAPFGA